MCQHNDRSKRPKTSLGESELRGYLEFASKLSADAGTIIRNRMEASFGSRLKPDRTVVTDVDIEVERFIAERIVAEFPNHGIIGEESTSIKRDGCLVWTIDPIDGTLNFEHKIPLFGTILSLLMDGTPVVGVINYPCLGKQFRAAVGLGAYRDSEPVLVGDFETETDFSRDILSVGQRSQFQDDLSAVYP